MNEHDESAPRARNTRKLRALKRPSRWLEKRAGAKSSATASAKSSAAATANSPAKSSAKSSANSSRPAAVTSEPVTTKAAQTSFDDHVADFFRKGDEAPAFAALELDEDVDPRRATTGAARPLDPARTAAVAAAARRRAYSRHVMVVVALSAALCIAGFVRSATSAPLVVTPADVVHASNAASVAAAPVVAAVAMGESRRPEVAPEVTPVATTETVAPEVTPVATTETVAPDVAVAAPVPAPSLSPVPARAAREDARRALDRGAVTAAIAAAKTSVELDPTDADAWLVLGAAYQLAGNVAAAHDAFSSCRKLATRGDVGECRAF